MRLPVSSCGFLGIWHKEKSCTGGLTLFSVCRFGPADFNEPFQPQAQAAPPVASGAPSDDDVAMIEALGFSREQALRALKATVSRKSA